MDSGKSSLFFLINKFNTSLKPTTKIKIKYLIEDLFELLDPLEKQAVLDRLEESSPGKQLQEAKKLARKEIVTEMALQINRATITK